MAMSASTPSSTRDLLEQTLASLPEGATVEAAMEKLLFLAKIDRGLKDLEAGRSLSTTELRDRLKA